MTKNLPHIERLFIYPVKGLRGVAVERARITPFGLAGDRRYMLVDASGRFISQRRFPILARFEVDLVSSAGGSSNDELKGGESFVRIQFEKAGVTVIPLEPKPSGIEPVPVTIWNDTVQARAVSNEVDAFLSDILGEMVRLVWMPELADRVADPDFAPPGERVSFADGFPLLVLGSASIEELNTRLESPIPINRFRANVIVGGSAPWQEDTWTLVESAEARLTLVKQCARCVVITTDQETGERSKEPTATLATYRVVDGKVMVGMNALAHPLDAHLHLGEALKVK